MEGFDWYQYAVGGAASRPDSFSRLDPSYAQAVAALLQAADEELGPRALRITSAYRSPELQAQLFEEAVAKYGSPEAARKWVAPPGRSRHNYGLAVDFANASGSLLRDPDSPEARWIAENAHRFGLDVPMSWEPWQVELAGSRDGRPLPPPTSSGSTAASSQPQRQAEAAPRDTLGNLMTAFEMMQGDIELCPPGYLYDSASQSCIPIAPASAPTVSRGRPTGSTALKRFGISSLV